MSLARTTETYSRGHSPTSSVVSGSVHAAPRSLSRQRGVVPLTPSASIRLDAGQQQHQRRPTLANSVCVASFFFFFASFFLYFWNTRSSKEFHR